MTTWQPSERLWQIIRSNTSDALLVYAGLFAECQANAQQLANLLDQPEWDAPMARDMGFANDRLGRPGTTPSFIAVETLVRLRGLPDGPAGLVRCAAVLKALDSWYGGQEGLVRYRTAELPGSPRTRYLFLPKPANRVLDWVPEELSLQRDASHFGVRVESLLELSWRLIRFGDEAAHGLRPRVEELTRHVERALEKRLAGNQTLRVALAAPFCERTFPIDDKRSHPRRDGRIPCRFGALPESEVTLAGAEIDALLDACSDGRVDILCLPELTVDPGLLRCLVRGLASSSRTDRPALVVAGSYHVPVAPRLVNRCHIYDGRGELLWHQDKVTPFGTTTSTADRPAFIEDIDRAEELRVVDASFARLGTPICLDFLAMGALHDFFRAASVNLFLVPAMSPRLEDFERRARDLGTSNRATTLVANSGWIPQMSQPPSPGIAYVPVRRDNGLVTTSAEHVGPLRIYDLAAILRSPTS